MRIVGGSLRGRRFGKTIAKGTRPTSDRVREAIASALEARELIQGARVLDLFAGTGAMAFEALSRGATHATLIEKSRVMIQGLRENVRVLGLEKRTTLFKLDLFHSAAPPKILAHAPFDLVFVDPPYIMIGRVGKLLTALNAGFHERTTVAIERSTDTSIPMDGELQLKEIGTYSYGDTSVELLQVWK